MNRHRRIQCCYAAVCGALAVVAVLGRDDRSQVVCTATPAPRWPDLAVATDLLARGCTANVFADLLPDVVVRTHGPLSGTALADLLEHLPPPPPLPPPLARGTELGFRDAFSVWRNARLGDAVRSGEYWTVSWSGPDVDSAVALMLRLNQRASRTGLLFQCARLDAFVAPDGACVHVFAPAAVASMPPELRRVFEDPVAFARAVRGRE